MYLNTGNLLYFNLHDALKKIKRLSKTQVIKWYNSAKQQNEILGIMISEAIKTSEIEGEMLSIEDVRSSFLKKLGLTKIIKNIKDRRAENIALLMLEIRNNIQTKNSE